MKHLKYGRTPESFWIAHFQRFEGDVICRRYAAGGDTATSLDGVLSHLVELDHIQPVAIMQCNPVVESTNSFRVPTVGAIGEGGGVTELEKVSRKRTSDRDPPARLWP